ncbi:MAG: UDP-N-acetylglucosamine 2-epimerase (hydrolyzing) [Phycisphaeraceae bacterium]|nr:UDP-N-acetylglucosamine 2-epimerase (hydrolyzing) [Phycisphaerae bacterium]MBX3391604.1 UDP-N-acetylglucosamine 2-epimerase (hydrolyzing) [Phycisphaeraceae bacterium]
MSTPRKALVVTGSRAEFGLLRPVMRAIDAHPGLELLVIAAGSHLISPGLTYDDVKRDFSIADSVPMQVAGRVGRPDDAEAVGRGISRFTRSFTGLDPDWVVVLGDRIEAFAAAAAAAIGGWPVAHLHGGDRAEGVHDEALRHAITKLAHLHLPATAQSAQRIIRMGEPESRVRIIGSPAVDELDAIEPLSDAEYASLGSPTVLMLMHPVGRHDEAEEWSAEAVIEALRRVGRHPAAIALHPNHDPGRRGVLRAIQAGFDPGRVLSHLPRDRFVGLLKRIRDAGGFIIGNSSSGLIESAALRLPAVDVGERQAGRERPSNVVHAQDGDHDAIAAAIQAATALDRSTITHPYGPGDAGRKAADTLASVDPRSPGLLRKHNAY